MTAILVHGVPDTDRVWHAVIPRLGRDDVVTVRLPGFGCPAPATFEATKDAYAAWLVEQMAAHGGPVDLVGHDWGALLVLRAACLRPDLVRTWAAGAPLVSFPGCSHWWPLERPAEVAALLTRHWEKLAS